MITFIGFFPQQEEKETIKSGIVCSHAFYCGRDLSMEGEQAAGWGFSCPPEDERHGDRGSLGTLPSPGTAPGTPQPSIHHLC